MICVVSSLQTSSQVRLVDNAASNGVVEARCTRNRMTRSGAQLRVLGLAHDIVDFEMTIAQGVDAFFDSKTRETTARSRRFAAEARSFTDFVTLVGEVALVVDATEIRIRRGRDAAMLGHLTSEHRVPLTNI